ncbi:MAG TPA: SDR family NAD(P)-dependent oxidoreductase [Thermoanaerobaculia bacterium]|nr:SDR family NAD(P)-dependent oxidoreductase [Thermoanaerobaculia bacterium]
MRAIITGASTGIGHALAHELAKRGYDLALLARRAELLEGLASELRARGKQAVAIACDVLDAGALRDAVQRAQTELGGTFDLAIANAGVSIPSHATKFKLDDAEQMIRVNVLGLMYLYDAVIPSMVEQGSGRFAGVASIAGLRGLPTSGPYSASKAAVQAFLEAARIELKPYGVGITIVNPGFVATPMTEKNRFRMPFLMQPGDAAVVIANGLERGSRVVEFPLPMSLLMRLVRYIPDALYERIMVPYARRKIDPAKVKR